MKLRYYIQKKFPQLYSALVKINNRVNGYKSREIKAKCGTLNPEKTIYIIRIRRETLGLMGYYMAVLGHLRIAEEKKAIPVVDLMNTKNPYITSKDVGKINAWELYFEQVNTQVSLREAYNSKNVILSNMETPFEANPRWFYERVYLRGEMSFYDDLVKTYLRYNKNTKEKLEEYYNLLFSNILRRGKKILGVVCRGTDLIGFPGHSVQPTIEELCSKVKESMHNFECEYVFMASDSNSAIEYFKTTLGRECVLYNECKRYDAFDKEKNSVLSEMHFDRENDEYLKGIEYLTTMYLLSKCNALIGSLVGSTIGAICMNCGEYEHIEIIDEGVYH